MSQTSNNTNSISNNNTNRIVQAIKEAFEELGNEIKNVDKKISILLKSSLERMDNLENKSRNIDNSVELLITNSVKKWLKDYASKHGFRMTIQAGNKFIKYWKKYYNDELITELDGCYILSNDKANVKYSNENTKLKSKNKVYESLEKELKKYESMYLDKQKTEKLSKLRKKHQELKHEINNTVVDDVVDELLNDLESEVIENTSSRVLCIIESKLYVRNEDVTDQVDKIKLLLDYIFNVKLFKHFENEPLKLKFISKWKNWSDTFLKINKTYNLIFDGILLFIGGSLMIKEDIQRNVDAANLTIVEFIKNKITKIEDELDNDVFYEFNQMELEFYKYVLLSCLTKQCGTRIILVQDIHQNINVRDA